MPKKKGSRNASNKAKSKVKGPPVGAELLVQRGELALALAKKHSAVNERLASGVISNMKSDLDRYIGARADTGAGKVAAKSATASQDQAKESLRLIVTGIRTSLVKIGAPKELTKAYGVGSKITQSVTTVIGAANVIIKRAEAKPQEARSLGILASDIKNLKTLVAQVTAADSTQGELLAKVTDGVAERNTIALRIWASVKEISGKGILAYPLDAQVRAAFDALDDIPTGGKGGGGGGGGGGGEPT